MSLEKIVSIKNVGRFLNCAATGDVTFRRYTLVFAENGRGKTTLCAVLRSLQSGDARHIVGRRTLGGADNPEARFLVGGAPAVFRNGAWDRTLPLLAVFDGTYVSENVYSGEGVAAEQRRNLYRVIVGAEGVQLARRIEDIDGQIKTKNNDIRDAQTPLQRHLPAGMTLDAFLVLAEDPQIDEKIEAKEHEVAGARQAEQIRQRATLSQIAIPALPLQFPGILAKTLAGIEADAERRVAKHIQAHAMGERGEPWLSEGLRYIHADACPFCSQSVEGVPLLNAYKTYFSTAYDAFREEITVVLRAVEAALNDREFAKIGRTMDQNAAAAEFWRQFCAFDAPQLPAEVNAEAALAAMRQAALALLERKAAAPLERIDPDDAYAQARPAVDRAAETIAAYNAAVTAANAVIAARKQQAGAAVLATLESELARLKATKTRHTEEVWQACSAYRNRVAEKGALENDKTQTRERLDAHTDQVIERYGQGINRYLDRFNAGFRITTPTHTYRGGPPSSSYQILINNTPVDLGDATTPIDRPSFRNTLSAGDRTTLALALFLAQLDQHSNRTDMTVVFDDPFTSQDNFRRSHTAFQIKRCGEICGQVTVLSHDPMFLKLVWDKLQPANRKTLQLARVNEENTTIVEWDIEKAVQARYRADTETLMKYHSLNEGDARDVIQKIRPVLEGYSRNLYPAQFADQDMLGAIVGKIRGVGTAHPLHPIADDLDEINQYCRRYHHADNPNAATEAIDDNELKGYVKRTLTLAGCF